MTKLDRLGWTAGLSFIAYGTRFGIRTNDPSVLGQAEQVLPLGWEPDEATTVDMLYSLWVGQPSEQERTRHYHLLYANAGRLARSLTLEPVLNSLEKNLQLVMAYMAQDFLFVHAGAVVWQGQAILIPGRSFSGKTSLVAALVKAGATYFSDEYAVLDPRGRVHPYPIPLSIRGKNGRGADKVPVEWLGGQVGEEAVPVGLIVVTKYKSGARWLPRHLSPGQAILALMSNTVAARRNPEFSLPVLQQAVTGATAIKTKRDEAEDVAELILKQLP